MASILLAYDLKKTTGNIHEELKKRLIENYGYSDKIQSTSEPTVGRWYDLPNTTLFKQNISCEQAVQDFLTACKVTGAVWERYITIERVRCVFNSREI